MESCRLDSLQISSALCRFVPVASAPNWKEQTRIRQIRLNYFVCYPCSWTLENPFFARSFCCSCSSLWERC